MNKEIVYINNSAKKLFKKLGCGDVDYITIYKKIGDDIFISVGKRGRFKSDKEEITLFTLK